MRCENKIIRRNTLSLNYVRIILEVKSFKLYRLGLYGSFVAIQIILMLTVVEVISFYFPLPRRDLSWGLTVYYYFIGFCFLSGSINLVFMLFRVNLLTILFCAVAIVFFNLFYSYGIESRPLRLPALMLVSGLLILVSFIGEVVYNKVAGKKNSSKYEVLDRDE